MVTTGYLLHLEKDVLACSVVTMFPWISMDDKFLRLKEQMTTQKLMLSNLSDSATVQNFIRSKELKCARMKQDLEDSSSRPHISHANSYSHTFMLLLTFAGFAVRLQGEPYGAAAAHPSGSVFTCPVTAAIVHCTGLCRWCNRDGKKREKGKKGVLTCDPLLLKEA